MSTTSTAPASNKPLIATKQVFDLDVFDEITIGKPVDFTPITTIDQALDAMGNDQEKLVRIINSGLREEALREARQTPVDDGTWHSFTDEGKLNGPYSGTVANPKKVNVIVLGLAKSVFGFTKNEGRDPQTREKNKQAKESAKAFIKANDTIREGLKKSAAFTSEDEDDENEAGE